ncbi:NAD(P)-dependent dehydrogenase, short-chain alcohol dehydrogenase family [Marinobacter salarius]|jgi:NAD(P)-dependent dehydrogenase (short-subunit alcohol dehydrogenase family)|uniref:NAD(P)-dependent dehydrogenase, short-chain alcohol dehydrogenase family n=1 Tax=Marinobacter salarius TaxID=1420917 RepID=W5YP48_9GAMM|nr:MULTISPECIES: SDR family oxidoreductase [Marinobacter]AHI30830.1 short-chain dehydrogenase [Marinobacter salarius]MBQ0747881.1 SDR family oxidoreductase [Marinobacter sp.]MBQ0815945.1 SDR family oxidoreductase [Marinobacter sp.]SFL86580.1 NAD(P)-dependent dehydrogenase, short-chain alcohol dehydrogenase family [Marinobacter salarius]|tara:strand:+ start:14644 stop:15348 length:705 start_codon:yes stop_codon:yes gene_type:complete
MKYALVTGGTRGIGSGVSRSLARAGYRVVATGVSDQEVNDFESLEGVVARKLDVTSQEQVDAMIASFEQLDAIVNCAGIIQRDGREFEPDYFAQTLEVNLTGTLRTCHAGRAKLIESGGSIVNTASMLSFFGSASAPGYAASKGGVAQLTKSLAAAWAMEGVRVNAVAPGWVATELTRPLMESDERSVAILSRTPMGRWGEPDEIGDVVLFLLSNQARFVTGAILPVDGGYSIV